MATGDSVSCCICKHHVHEFSFKGQVDMSATEVGGQQTSSLQIRTGSYNGKIQQSKKW